jgi:signal transduction histidine kinase
MLVESATDNQLMIETSRNIRIVVDRKSFEVLNSVIVLADIDLLEQAINNVLDNAAKYSYRDTSIRMSAGLTHGGRFHISVLNTGLKIGKADVKHCIERGWRSEMATLTTGEGSGIGLWIVNLIMQIHQGELIVSPTNAKNQTDVKLIMPLQMGK